MRVRWWACAAVVLAVAAGVALGAVWRPFGGPAAPTPTPTPPQDVFALPAGACIREFADAWQDSYEVVDCAEPHAAEVLGTVPMAEVFGAELPEAWPGDAPLAERANLACEQASGFTGDAPLAVRWPLEPDWAARRSYLCFAVLPPAPTPG